MRETITADVQREQDSAVAIGSSHKTAYTLMAPTRPLRQRLASSTRHASPRVKPACSVRGGSQRQLGDMLALDKAVGSTRINRYEQQLSLYDIKNAKVRITSMFQSRLCSTITMRGRTIPAFAQLPETEHVKSQKNRPDELRSDTQCVEGLHTS